MASVIHRQRNLCSRSFNNSLLSGRCCIRRGRRIDMHHSRRMHMHMAALSRGARRRERNQHGNAKHRQSYTHREVGPESHARFYTEQTGFKSSADRNRECTQRAPEISPNFFWVVRTFRPDFPAPFRFLDAKFRLIRWQLVNTDHRDAPGQSPATASRSLRQHPWLIDRHESGGCNLADGPFISRSQA